jgi:hypothetical protein
MKMHENKFMYNYQLSYYYKDKDFGEYLNINQTYLFIYFFILYLFIYLEKKNSYLYFQKNLFPRINLIYMKQMLLKVCKSSY